MLFRHGLWWPVARELSILLILFTKSESPKTINYRLNLMIIVISNLRPAFNSNIPSAQFLSLFQIKFIVKFMLSMVTLLMWLYFLTLIRVVRFSKSFYAKKMFSNDVMSSFALDVTWSFHRGVYCSWWCTRRRCFGRKGFWR